MDISEIYVVVGTYEDCEQPYIEFEGACGVITECMGDWYIPEKGQSVPKGATVLSPEVSAIVEYDWDKGCYFYEGFPLFNVLVPLGGIPVDDAIDLIGGDGMHFQGLLVKCLLSHGRYLLNADGSVRTGD